MNMHLTSKGHTHSAPQRLVAAEKKIVENHIVKLLHKEKQYIPNRLPNSQML